MNISKHQKTLILESLAEHLARRDTTNVSTAAIQKDMEELVWARQATMETLVIPWIQRTRSLRGLSVLEPGCGMGPMTCALAKTGCSLASYEIDPIMVRAASARLSILGLQGPAVFHVSADDAVDDLPRRFPDGVDAIPCIGILEHIPEVPRLELMRCFWNLLRPGGLFIVAHTPNRLTYHDLHATRMPFGHMLPDQIAIRYFGRAPHDAYRESMKWAAAQSEAKLIEMRHGFGTGLSFHDFEIAFGTRDIQSLVADDGLGPEMMAWYRDDLETNLLWQYMQSVNLPLSRGWSRQFLNIIFRKS